MPLCCYAFMPFVIPFASTFAFAPVAALLLCCRFHSCADAFADVFLLLLYLPLLLGAVFAAGFAAA